MVTWLAASKIMNCRPDTRMVLMTSMVYQAATKILIVSLSERAPVSLVEILELFKPELAVRQDLEPSLSQRLQGPFFQWGGLLARLRRLLHRWRRSSLLRRWRGLLYQRRLSQLHRRINAGICSAVLLASPKLQHLAVPVILLEGLFTECIHWKCWWPRIGAQNMLQGQYAPMTARPIILLPVPNKLKDIHGTPRMGLHMFAPTQQQHVQYVRLETSYRTNCQTERSKCGKVRNDSETCFIVSRCV